MFLTIRTMQSKTSLDGIVRQTEWSRSKMQMLVRIWGKGNTSSLLMGVQTVGTTTVNLSQNNRSRSTTYSQDVGDV